MIMRGRPASVFAKARVVMFVALAGSLLCAQTGRTSLRNKVAETPPMGWNSYDYYNWTVDEAETMANAEWMAKRLKPYGWQYVVVDFLWSMPLRKNTFSHRQWRRHGRPRFRLAMDADGRLLPDPGRFPSSAGGGGFRALSLKQWRKLIRCSFRATNWPTRWRRLETDAASSARGRSPMGNGWLR